MMTKHTPGPWVVKSARSGFYVESQFDVIVDSLDESGRYGAIYDEANARLIAAAPELLEALKAIRDKVGSCICYVESAGEITYGRWPQPPLLRRKRTRIDLLEMVEAAIAKAKGEQP